MPQNAAPTQKQPRARRQRSCRRLLLTDNLSHATVPRQLAALISKQPYGARRTRRAWNRPPAVSGRYARRDRFDLGRPRPARHRNGDIAILGIAPDPRLPGRSLAPKRIRRVVSTTCSTSTATPRETRSGSSPSPCSAHSSSRRSRPAPGDRSAPSSEPAPARPSAGTPARSSPTTPSSTRAPGSAPFGIPRPPDREALLATYLDRQSAPALEPRLCACGCGQPIVGRPSRGRPREVPQRRAPQTSSTTSRLKITRATRARRTNRGSWAGRACRPPGFNGRLPHKPGAVRSSAGRLTAGVGEAFPA